jgi:hypothetical protein
MKILAQLLYGPDDRRQMRLVDHDVAGTGGPWEIQFLHVVNGDEIWDPWATVGSTYELALATWTALLGRHG